VEIKADGTRNLTGLDPEILSSSLNHVRFDADGRVHYEFACGYVIFPAVPWASDGDTLELALRKGPSSMQTGVVDRIELVSYVRDSYRQAIDLKLANRTRWNLVFSRRTHKTHLRTPSVTF
jgi:hypothetical protein